MLYRVKYLQQDIDSHRITTQEWPAGTDDAQAPMVIPLGSSNPTGNPQTNCPV